MRVSRITIDDVAVLTASAVFGSRALERWLENARKVSDNAIALAHYRNDELAGLLLGYIDGDQGHCAHLSNRPCFSPDLTTYVLVNAFRNELSSMGVERAVFDLDTLNRGISAALDVLGVKPLEPAAPNNHGFLGELALQA
jgi:hypothetical protein